MRVARLHAAEDLRLATEPDPEPADGEVLVRVRAVGLCGSDLHWWSEGAIGDAVLARPVVPGHEMAGELADGTLVAIDPAIPCGRCEQCLEGNGNLCPSVIFAGHGVRDGGLCELMTWPAGRVFSLPQGFSAADGAMLEPLGVALHAVDLAHPRPAWSVAVVGLGPIGLLLVQLARVFGAARVTGVDPLPHRRDAALRLGADVAVEPPSVPELDGDANVVFEAAGTDSAVALALELARPGARVVLAGIPDDDRTAFPAGLARRKGLTLVIVRRTKDTYPRAISLVAAGRVDVRSLVSSVHPLADSVAAFRAGAGRTGLKVVIDPSS